jgi:hypothetical protein
MHQIWWCRYQKHVSQNTPQPIRVHVHAPQTFPNDIIAYYSLRKKALNGYIYMEICQGMCGLLQAGILANKLLRQRLGCHGYFEVQHMPGLWKHISCPI